jgi:hypothetical protein
MHSISVHAQLDQARRQFAKIERKKNRRQLPQPGSGLGLGWTIRPISCFYLDKIRKCRTSRELQMK